MSTPDLLEPVRVAIALGAELPACEGMVVWEAWRIDGAFIYDTRKTGGYAFLQGSGRRIGIYATEQAARDALGVQVTTGSGKTDHVIVKVVIA